MTSYTHITEFEQYMFDKRVREITIVEYLRRGGVWRKLSGQILTHPQFGYRPWTCVTIKLWHIDISSSDFGRRASGDTSEHFFTSEYDEEISLEVKDTEAVLHGFLRNGTYRVDIVAHAHTR